MLSPWPVTPYRPTSGSAGRPGVSVPSSTTRGAPHRRAIPALPTHRTERAEPLDWIQLGSTAGPDIALPSAVLRAAELRILGSGQRSVTAAGIIAERPSRHPRIHGIRGVGGMGRRIYGPERRRRLSFASVDTLSPGF
jgi:hypothetical protein